MGRKAGTLFINPKRFGNLQKPCMKEMALFLSCMAANHSDTDACARQKELLNVCIDAQSKKNRKSWGSINYQLQRLNRGRNGGVLVRASPGAAVKLCLGDLLVMGSNPETASLHMQE
ncbi:hypothetical protein GmHk_05G013648 [Glycine max]|nr:hypothetical protein GmHk_05G013648 [Glycine max]